MIRGQSTLYPPYPAATPKTWPSCFVARLRSAPFRPLSPSTSVSLPRLYTVFGDV